MTLYFLSTLLAAFLILDMTYIGQFMLSEPLFMLPLLGAVSGHTAEGITAGMNLEFIFLGRLAVGASIPPSAAFSGAVFWGGFLLTRGDGAWVMPALFFPSVIAGYWGRSIDHFFRKLHNEWAEAAFEAFGKHGKYSFFLGQGLVSAGVFVFINWVSILLLSWSVHKIAVWSAPLWQNFFQEHYLLMIWKAMPVMTVLFLLDRFNDRKNNPYLVGGILAGLTAGGILWAIL
ncbi:MAG TPA: hypothetical protein ENN72_03175 [Firmicutes bacterium]|nr:hypothetical protein [Bacillota bacterium]